MAFSSAKTTDTMGGQSQIDLFLVRKKDDGSGYDILDPAAVYTSPTFPSSPDLPVLGSPTRETALLYSFQLLADHKMSFDDKGIPSIDSLDNYDSGKQFRNILGKIGLPSGSSVRSRPEYFLENHVKKGGAIAADKMVVAIQYDQLDIIENTVDVNGMLGGVQLTSLGSHKDGEYVKPEFKIAGTIPEANIALPAALFDSGKVTVSGAQTLYSNNIVYNGAHTAASGAR